MHILSRVLGIGKALAERVDSIEARVTSLEREAAADRAKLGGVLMGIRQDVEPLTRIIREHGKEVMAELRSFHQEARQDREYWIKRVAVIEARVLDLERRLIAGNEPE